MARDPTAQYEAKKHRLIKEMTELLASSSNDIGLNKTTSNLFRDRRQSQQRLNVRDFNSVIKVDPKTLTAEVEGMTTFDNFVKATLEHHLIPLVVPQLKTITVGGGVSGLAIESSSFKLGLVHDGVLSMEVLLPSGKVVECRPDNQYKDLFYGLPNSYGTLGYILKLTMKLRPAKPYVRLQHLHFDKPQACFDAMEAICKTGKYKGQAVDFLDGVVFGPGDHYLTLGFDSEDAPYTSDYTYMKVYYRSIRQRQEDYLSTHDYLWRWDTDWFWCSKNLMADRKLVRLILGRKRLGSETYSKLMRLGYRHGKKFTWLNRSSPRESVIQDIEVTIDKAPQFLRQFQKQIDIRPVWLCPTQSPSKSWLWPLYPMNPAKLYVNFGFWDTVPTTHDPASGYYNKKVEALVDNLSGMKSLYSTVHYDRPTFERKYNYMAYEKLKKKYDPKSHLKSLYDKVIGRS